MRCDDLPAPVPDAGRAADSARATWPGLIAAVLLLLSPACAAVAMEVKSVEAGREGPAYVLRIEAVLAAPPGRLMAVLTDYDRIHELHPRILQSRSLGRVDQVTEEVYTRFEGCVLFFCRSLDRVERIQVVGHTLFAEDVPGRGSFSEGRTVWRMAAEGTGTRLHYVARFVPAFWVAPLIGPGVLARSVERMTIETMAEVERRAVAGDDD